jgi:methylisocitrate lyase
MSETAGARFRAALTAESPLQVMGAITAYAGLMAKRTGYKALYLSGGGVAANSLGVPDLGISTMEDVLTDARRIVDATGLPLLVDIDTGWGGAFNIGRTIRSFERIGVAAVHMEDQVGQKRCGHRPGKEVVSTQEMVDRVKSAVDARTDAGFVIMARTDAAAVEGLDSAIERAVAYVEAGADMVFPEAMTSLEDYRKVKAAVNVPILANLTVMSKPKKSVALSGTPPATPRCAPSAAAATTCITAATTSSTFANTSEFEEIAYLLVHGKLPNKASELAGYKAKLKSLRGMPAAVKDALESCRLRRIRWT